MTGPVFVLGAIIGSTQAAVGVVVGMFIAPVMR